jgi:pimeloyl-ACP methyl ester carboxylesterase
MYKQYIKNEQLNFQINRFLEPYYENEKVQDDIFRSCAKIKSLDDWYLEWRSLGDSEIKKNNSALASAYYQLADFYLRESDERKEETYELFKQTFYQSIQSVSIEKISIPYKKEFLPVAVIRNNKKSSKWLVFHGGFDSYLEELIRLSITYLSNLEDFNILMFEGPGQGEALRNGLYMQYNWEEPVTAVLDYFHLENVTLLGMSLGGYLAVRAATKEKRISKVIAFDTFYSMSDAFLMSAPAELQNITDLSDPISRIKINKFLEEYSSKSIDFRFKLNKARDMFGIEDPVNIIEEIQKYSLEGIEDEITQEVLLLAGDEDMYVPSYRTAFLQKKLTNANRVVSELFTRKTGGQYHCQVGNKEVAFEAIVRFLKQKDTNQNNDL